MNVRRMAPGYDERVEIDLAGLGPLVAKPQNHFQVTHDFAAKERGILLHGGLLHYLSEQAPA